MSEEKNPSPQPLSLKGRGAIAWIGEMYVGIGEL